jgi:protein-disulfide isomerase
MSTETSEGTEHVYGDANAPITVCEFGDFECPYCLAAAPVLRELVDTSNGQVRLVFRNFPLFEVHPHALTAALAAESASASGGEEVYWAMHWALLHHQTRLDDDSLRLYAREVGADPDTAAGDAAQQFAPIVQADYAMGVEAGVPATPTLFINGDRYEGRMDLASLRREIGMSDPGQQSAAKAGRRPWQRR